MSEIKTHILLISYVFPPYYGIGGRRWARHAEELTRLGYVVHVICAKNPFDKISLWFNVIKNNKNIIIYTLPARYPSVFVNYDHSIFQKFQYKMWNILLPFFTKGSYFDRTIFWKNMMLKKATGIIESNNIKHVICSGGPFSVMYFATLLKDKFKDLFLLNDLRDPWTWGPNWGYATLNKKRMAYEKALEKKTLEKSDVISVPTNDMKAYLLKAYPSIKEKIVCIPHFFDPLESIPQIKTASVRVRFVMYGTIYQGMEQYLKKIAQLFDRYKNQVALDVYTDQQQHAQSFAAFHASNVKFHKTVLPAELFAKFKEYDFVFLLNPPYNKNNISTKFYEIIATRTPIFILSEYGQGPEFIIKNNLGIWSNLEDLDKKFKEFVSANKNFNYNSKYDVRRYSLPNIGRQLHHILETCSAFEIDELAVDSI